MPTETETKQAEAAPSAPAPVAAADHLQDPLNAVRVHQGSGQPAQLQAQAYAQGSEIQAAPGQESALPHEAAHVVQQASGRQPQQ
ncbi:MAG: DUF4157 domain-containing protein [Myxococcota bacterium]|nr:DUF4157 domain-containing protein [Myxococcota bacterium]